MVKVLVVKCSVCGRETEWALSLGTKSLCVECYDKEVDTYAGNWICHEYYLNHKAEVLARQHEYYLFHREEINKRRRANAKAHRKEESARWKRWYHSLPMDIRRHLWSEKG